MADIKITIEITEGRGKTCTLVRRINRLANRADRHRFRQHLIGIIRMPYLNENAEAAESTKQTIEKSAKSDRSIGKLFTAAKKFAGKLLLL